MTRRLTLVLCMLIATPAMADTAATHYNRALALKKLGNIDKAIAEMKKALEQRKDYAAVHRSIGILYRKKKAYNKAVYHLQRAVALEPKGETYFSLGLALYRHGRKADAIKALAKAHQLSPKDAHIALQYGIMLSRKDPEKAIGALKKAVALDKKNGEALHQLGVAYRRASARAGKDKKKRRMLLEQAAKYLTRASVFNDDERLHFDLGVLNRRLEKFEAAAVHYEKAIQKNSKMAAAWWDVGHVYANLKRYRDAAHAYKQYLKLTGGKSKEAGVAKARVKEYQTKAKKK